jgi:hypothetical protein
MGQTRMPRNMAPTRLLSPAAFRYVYGAHLLTYFLVGVH